MKDPTSVRTNTRDEMICPKCYTQGLVPNSAFASDYSNKNAEIIKATKCPNEECEFHSGVPEEVIRKQYETQSILSRLVSSDSDSSSKSTILGIVIICVLAVAAASFFGVIPFGTGTPQTADITGTVTTPDGTQANASLLLLTNATNEVYQTNTTGEFTVNNVSYGSYILRAQPTDNSQLNSVDQNIIVNQTGVNLQSPILFANQSNQSITLSLSQPTQQNPTQILGGERTLTTEIDSPANYPNGLNISLSPITDTTRNETVKTSNTTRFTIPSSQINQGDLFVTGQQTRETITSTYQHQGQTNTIEFFGSETPQNIEVTIPTEANIKTQTRTQTIQSGDTLDFTVQGDSSIGNPTVSLSGTQKSNPTVENDIYTGTNPTVNINSDSLPSTATLTLTGNIQTQEKRQTGTVTQNQLQDTITGSLPAENATIQFTGGTPENNTISDITLTASGQDGTQTAQKPLISNTDEATYRINLDQTVQNQPQYITSGYIINGDRREVDADRTVSVDMEAGQSISVFLTAEQEPVPTSEYTHNGQFNIRSFETSTQTVQPGGDIGLRATIRNPSASQRTETIPVFKDGERIQQKTVSIRGGAQRTVNFNRIGFNQESVHTIQVSDSDATQITVGDAELNYGSGELQSTLTRVGNAGTIEIDTTGNGQQNAQVSANGGTVQLNSIEPGSFARSITQNGVTNTRYELSYTQRNGARDITVDMNEDGVAELTHNGILNDGQSITESVTLNQTSTELNFNVGNNERIPYELSYTEENPVSQPTVILNGNTVIDESETFTGERTYNITQFTGGENTLRFESTSANGYNVQVKWNETSSNTTPRLQSQTTTLCSQTQLSNGQCSISSTNIPQNNTLSLTFNNGADQFEYTISYTAVTIPQTITATVNEETYTVTKEEANTITESGVWTAQTDITDTLTEGQNQYTISTQLQNGINTTAISQINYQYQVSQATNPTIQYTVQNQTIETQIPQTKLTERGELTETTQVTIPQNKLQYGNTIIQLISENNGNAEVTVNTT